MLYSYKSNIKIYIRKYEQMNKNKFNLPPGLLGNEFSKPEATYAQEKFNTVEVSCEESDVRSTYNKYKIGDKELIFRSFNEVPAIDGPAKWLNHTDVVPSMKSAAERASNVVNSEREDAVLIVPTSPEGLVSAIREVSGDTEAFADLLNENDGSFNVSEKSKMFLDSIIASTLFDDDGNERSSFEGTGAVKLPDNGDGFALFVAGMAGDSEALELVNKKLEKYYERIDSEEVSRRERASSDLASLEARVDGLESLSKNEVLLVHSTPHDIERDDNGNIVLYSAASKREDRYPRSSVHFTANGEVQPHSLGQWNDSNKLIVTNFEDVHGANGNPRTMSEVDTWYTLNPQEGMTLPNARVIEPSELENGALIEKDGDVYKYHAAESYTSHQIEQIQAWAAQLGLAPKDTYSEMLREISFRTAGRELGIDKYVSIQDHYSADSEFNDKYRKLADELGVNGGLHGNVAEGRLEKNLSPSMKASLEANRTLAWSGALKTRVASQAHTPFDGFGGGLI